MIKLSILLRRRADLSHQQFVDHHRGVHADVFMSVPAVAQHVRRYVQCHTLQGELPGLPGPTFDGITELWFDDVAAVAAVFTDPTYLAVVRPDEESFLDLGGCQFLLTEEHVVHAGSSQQAATDGLS